jgi:hypothetical protein
MPPSECLRARSSVSEATEAMSRDQDSDSPDTLGVLPRLSHNQPAIVIRIWHTVKRLLNVAILTENLLCVCRSSKLKPGIGQWDRPHPHRTQIKVGRSFNGVGRTLNCRRTCITVIDERDMLVYIIGRPFKSLRAKLRLAYNTYLLSPTYLDGALKQAMGCS